MGVDSIETRRSDPGGELSLHMGRLRPGGGSGLRLTLGQVLFGEFILSRSAQLAVVGRKSQTAFSEVNIYTASTQRGISGYLTVDSNRSGDLALLEC